MSGRPYRARRTVLAVPGSSDKFIASSRGLPVDCVFLDLEDGVATPVKEESRARIVEALNAGGWTAPTVTVRINDWTTPWTAMDLWTVVTGAGAHLDALIIPKVRTPGEVVAVDLLLRQAEIAAGLPVGRIGLEVQIEEAVGLTNIDAIAGASPRIETLVYGPGDWMASMGMRELTVGSRVAGYPGDAFHTVLTRILIAARAHGLQAIDGPFVQIRDAEGFTEAARKVAALGFDGKWVVHPSQIEIGNQTFTPPREVVDRARRVVAAFEEATSRAGGAVGAIVVDDEMVDEAGMKVAQAILARVPD